MTSLRIALAEGGDTTLGAVAGWPPAGVTQATGGVVVAVQHPFRFPGRTAARWRVLVATDADDGLARRLVAVGCEVTACRVAETPATADVVRPHLLLVDATAAGREAVRRVRATGWAGGLRVVAVGGWEPTDCRAEAAAGCDGHLTHPVTAEEVACLLDR